VIEGGCHDVRLVFHLGPEVQAELNGDYVILRWPAVPVSGTARLELSCALGWRLHRGETDPILGWYSPGLGHRVPALTLVGSGRCEPGTPLATRLEFLEAGHSPKTAGFLQAVSLYASNGPLLKAPEIRVEPR
jgi:hypothetical protein